EVAVGDEDTIKVHTAPVVDGTVRGEAEVQVGGTGVRTTTQLPVLLGAGVDRETTERVGDLLETIGPGGLCRALGKTVGGTMIEVLPALVLHVKADTVVQPRGTGGHVETGAAQTGHSIVLVLQTDAVGAVPHLALPLTDHGREARDAEGRTGEAVPLGTDVPLGGVHVA